MKSLKNIFIGILALCSLSFVSCTDLEEHPYDVLTSEQHEFTEDELNATFGPIYNSILDVYWGWFGMVDIMDESSDVWGVPYRIGIGWGDLYVSMHKHQLNSEIGFFETTWQRNYTGIQACNRALANEVVAKNREKSAEVRAYRALYYYNLFDFYRNIPLDTTYIHPEGWQPKQSTPQETFDFIESELLEIAEDCSSEVALGSMNKYAAYMLLAKMYLNHNAWFKDDSDKTWYSKCIDVLDKVMAGPFELAANYKDNFREDISKSPEIIFGIPLEIKFLGGNYMANMWMHVAGRATWNFNGWATGGATVFPQFIDTYDPDDQRYADCWIFGQQYDSNGKAIIDDEGDPLVYTKEIHSIDNPGCYKFEGGRLVKYEIKSGDYGSNYDDVPYFRLADAYLMKAECLLRMGKDEDTAAALVTEVRRRNFASNPSKAVVTAAQLKAGSKYNYGHRENQGTMGEEDKWIITEEGGADIEFGGLLDELAWEFVAEAHRRDDLIRFMIKGTNNNVYNGKSWFCKDAVSDRNGDIFPLPKVALDGNPNLVQNPGY